MQDGDLRIRVPGEVVQSGRPAPYDVYTAEGALLMKKGQVLTDAEQLDIVRALGWRVVDPDEGVPARAVSREEAVASVLPSDVRLPTRQPVPLMLAEALIADDMKLIRQLLTRMLREKGVTKIKEAEDGRGAVSLFFRYRPHMAFLDIDMPGIDGLSALRQIKQWSPGTFVCMVTANSTLLNVKEAKACGVDAFLVKPINALNLGRVLAMYQKRAAGTDQGP